MSKSCENCKYEKLEVTVNSPCNTCINLSKFEPKEKGPVKVTTANKLEIEKTLICSTSHYTKNDDDLLYRLSVETDIVAQVNCGFIIKLDPDYDHSRDSLFMRLSMALGQVIEVAKNNECTQVKFDSDGPVIEGYVTYEW